MIISVPVKVPDAIVSFWETQLSLSFLASGSWELSIGHPVEDVSAERYGYHDEMRYTLALDGVWRRHGRGEST
jgi:hypothetical protein